MKKDGFIEKKISSQDSENLWAFRERVQELARENEWGLLRFTLDSGRDIPPDYDLTNEPDNLGDSYNVTCSYIEEKK